MMEGGKKDTKEGEVWEREREGERERDRQTDRQTERVERKKECIYSCCFVFQGRT